MATRVQVHGIEVLDGFIARCRDFMDDWLLFNQILAAYSAPGANKLQLEMNFLQLKSKLARDHRVLTDRLGPDCRFGADIINIVSGATNLEGIYTQSEVAVRKLQNEWHRAFITVNETLGNLEDKHRRALAGERVNVGGLWVHNKIRKPVPWKKIFMYGGGVAAMFAIIFGLYFMRTFLGVWAPGAGDGIAVSAEMSDEEKMRVVLDTMKHAVEAGDIDAMMTAYSDKYADEGGRGKTEVRALLQAYKVSGGFEGAKLDSSSAKITFEGEKATFAPVHFIGQKDQATLTVTGRKEGERWLITSLDGI